MFTWNFRYVSRTRLTETFNQLALNSQRGDILIRIHTAIHDEEEAVELAAFVKNLVPGAHIVGTSTSAVIYDGKMVPNQCVISVTQLQKGFIRSAMIPTLKDDRETPVEPVNLCLWAREKVVRENTKLMLTFLTGNYHDVPGFIAGCNEYLPWVQMIGGLVNTTEVNLRRFVDSGFVFNEREWSSDAVMVATISGDKLEAMSSYATGVQALGEEMTITGTKDTTILTLDNKDATKVYLDHVGEAVKERPDLANLFPYVYSDTPDIPLFVRYDREHIHANYRVETGRKIRPAFIHDRKVLSDDRKLFIKIENFEKAETLFGYSSTIRSLLYPNSVKWEISAYENSSLCGCITDGEFVYSNGKNTFANCAFAISVMGEAPATPRFNSYVFSHTESLATDNQNLLSYLMEIEEGRELHPESGITKELEAFVRDCELTLLYSDSDELPNEAALNMDMALHGYDRICMIQVADVNSINAVFPKQVIDLTYRSFISKCVDYADRKNYRIYSLDKWHVAIGAPSYMVKLSQFTGDMERLQHELFTTTGENIAIIPIFCVIDNCSLGNLYETYNTARSEMIQKNIQFFTYDAGANELDEESIRERYHMVNVINYAIANDGIIPYYQGIYDNQMCKIHHYESLMRIVDEEGKLYYPGDFLDVARRYGLLYDSISKIMIQKVFNRFRYLTDQSVSINLGIRDIKNPEVTDMIYEFLPTVAHPENFVFEILENEDVDDYDRLVVFVDKIHSLGGRISIDDFGSGYSNLQHVLSIQADYLKLDGSIIRNCCVDKDSENLVALMSGWRNLSKRKMEIVAEYVENEEIQKIMMLYGIDYSQGYLFSRPSPQIKA